MTNKIQFQNGVEIELRQEQSGFKGLGSIRVDDVELRNDRRPMFVSIRNPDAIQFTDWVLEKEEERDDGVVLELSGRCQQKGLMEWMCHEVRNRLALPDWTAESQPAEDTRLELMLRPVTRTIGGERYAGFSYQYKYRGESIRIYWILDFATWEPRGGIVGDTFWLRNNFVRPISTFESTEDRYCTEWYMDDILQPNIFQFIPFQTELPGFTYTASPAGTLVTWSPRVAHIRSLFQKKEGLDELEHWHQHCGDLACEFETSPMEVLFVPGERDFVGHANRWEAVKETVFETLHKDIGMRRERVSAYGIMEEWDDADLELYREEGLPKLINAGMQKVYLANHFQNNMNVFGVSNMCCTVDYKVAESVGEDKLRRFCQAAQEHGLKVDMWGNTSISTLGYMAWRPNGRPKRIDFLPREDSIKEAIDEAECPFVRNPSGAIEADHYAPVFAVLNLRDPAIRDYWMKRWSYAAEEIGLDGIFLDSSFNLSSDKFHYQPNPDPGQRGGKPADGVKLRKAQRPREEPQPVILSQYRAHLDLMVRMQEAGYDYGNEDMGVFGVHRHGPGVKVRMTSLPLWSECLASFDAEAIEQGGGDPDEVFFKGLAYRMMWLVHWDPESNELSFKNYGIENERDVPNTWHIEMFKAFNEVSGYMRNRTILPGEKGVKYTCKRGEIIWAFEPFDHQFAREREVQIFPGGKAIHTDSLRTNGQKIYRVTSDT
ncbi:MAG: hypothetical protein KGZ25_07270 [Planctomycetes bacterium]|nr:hypothetical protein [Planctomycetota bacterium]